MNQDPIDLAHRISEDAAVRGRLMSIEIGRSILDRASSGMDLTELTTETLAIAHCAVGLISLSRLLFGNIAKNAPGVGSRYFPILMEYLQKEFDDVGIKVRISIVEESDDGKDLAGSPGVAGGPKGV